MYVCVLVIDLSVLMNSQFGIDWVAVGCEDVEEGEEYNSTTTLVQRRRPTHPD